METNKVGIRGFRSGLADYIASDTPVTVTRHGQMSGYFITANGQADADSATLKKAAAELDRLLASQALDVEAVAAEFQAARRASGKRSRRSGE